MSIADRVSQFVDFATKNPFWTAATTVFVAAFWFVIAYGEGIPGRIAEFERDTIRFEGHKGEQAKIAGLHDALSNAVLSISRTNKIYKDKFAGRPASEDVGRDVISEGGRLAKEARETVALAIGRFEGTSFEDARLQGHKAALQKDVAYLGEWAVRWEKFFLLQFLGRKEEALQLVKEMDEPGAMQALEAMLTRLEQFGPLATRVIREHRQDVSEQLGKLWLYSVKGWVVLLSVLYLVGFGVAAAIAVFRWREAKSNPPAPQPRNRNPRPRSRRRAG